MAGFAGGDSDEVFAGINVTPLVDVTLVLLIIFMITAPVIYQSAIKVQLPKATTGEDAKKSPLNFTITKEGDLMWDKEKLDWNAFITRLAQLGPKVSDETAIISADEATPHGKVIRVMDALRQQGLTHFALNVEQVAPPQK